MSANSSSFVSGSIATCDTDATGEGDADTDATGVADTVGTSVTIGPGSPVHPAASTTAPAAMAAATARRATRPPGMNRMKGKLSDKTAWQKSLPRLCGRIAEHQL